MGGVSSLSRADLAALSGSASISSFGDAVGVELRPLVNVKATYGILNDMETFSATGGSVTASNGEFVCQSGTSVGGYGTIWTKKPVIYTSGLGCEGRATARFTSPVALSTQLVGLFSAADGMFFGYNGTDFGIMHRYGGEFEIRIITISAVASGAETVTVTLNGVAYNLSVNSSATVQEAAHDVEQQLIASAANSLWYFQHINDTIVCMYRGTGAKSGTYSVASTGTLAGSVAQTNAGADPTETWVNQADWNKDTVSWLDKTKGNLYRFEFAYLGYGPLNYYVMHPNTKRWVLVHQITWNNEKTSPNFGNPSLRIGWAAASLGSSGTNLTVAGASAMAGIQGKSFDGVRTFAAVGTDTSITSQITVLSLKVRREFGGRACLGIAIPTITVATDSTKGMIFRVYKNATVAGDTNHQYVDQTNSICLYDTAGTTVSGGTLIYSIAIGPNGSRLISSSDLDAFLVAGDELTVTGEVTTGAASGGYVTIASKEIV